MTMAILTTLQPPAAPTQEVNQKQITASSSTAVVPTTPSTGLIKSEIVRYH